MTDAQKINDRFTVGLGHPSAEDLQRLADGGYRAVVNLRREEEEGQPLRPDEEGEKVRQLGMAYRHIPVAADAIEEALVDRFRESVGNLDGPIYVHCASGKRSGAFTMMHVAAESGMSGEETLRKAEAMGFECDSEALMRFVRDYVDQRRS